MDGRRNVRDTAGIRDLGRVEPELKAKGAGIKPGLPGREDLLRGAVEADRITAREGAWQVKAWRVGVKPIGAGQRAMIGGAWAVYRLGRLIQPPIPRRVLARTAD